MPHMEFGVFRAAALEWLATAPALDPSLVAAADVLNATVTERQIRGLARATDDTHAAFGAAAVLDLWQAAKASPG
jgi:hypothetical protein